MNKIVSIVRKNRILYFLISRIIYIILGGVNLIQELTAWLRIKGIDVGKYSSIKKYKNKFSGKRCFIIATGPSLTIEDLEKLNNEYTFGMNSLCLAYEKTDFRPTFYGIQDHLVYKKIYDSIKKYYTNKDNIFVSSRIRNRCNTEKSWNYFPLNISYHAYDNWFNNKYRNKFSNDCYKTVYDGFSITYSLIELAAYMGFKEIYLIGADCGYSKTGSQHFMEHGHVDPTFDLARERMMSSYKTAQKFSEENGIKIFNATRGGYLELFERVDLDKVI